MATYALSLLLTLTKMPDVTKPPPPFFAAAIIRQAWSVLLKRQFFRWRPVVISFPPYATGSIF